LTLAYPTLIDAVAAIVDNRVMQRRLVFIASWITVTGVSVLIATQAVGTVRNQVTDTPATLPTIAAVGALGATTEPSPVTSTATPGTFVPSTTQAPQATTTEALADGTTTTAPSVPSTPPPPSTTAAPVTTEAPAEMETATYQLTGGWVRIRYGAGEVHLVDAAPHAGYSMKPEKTGPIKVEIEFEGGDYEGKFKADMEDGSLDIDIDEGGDEDDD
jgi:hypothetical protein